MIHRVYANKKSFHEVTFTEGLNVVLAEKDNASSNKNTRNGVGKTTLLEIIDFCLGAYVSKGKGLIIDQLADWEFGMEVTLAGCKVQVVRSICHPDEIRVFGDIAGWRVGATYDELDGTHVYSVDAWNRMLGTALFDLPNLDRTNKSCPHEHGMIGFFLRLGFNSYSDAFALPRKPGKGRDKVNLACLLGLDWEFLIKLQNFKEQLANIAALDKGIRSGILQDTAGSKEGFELICHNLEHQVIQQEDAIQSYKIDSQYESLKQEADRLTDEIHLLQNENILDGRKLRRYELSMHEDVDDDPRKVAELYEQVGLVFEEHLLASLEEVKNFHQAVVKNRNEFLQDEFDRLSRAIDERRKVIDEKVELRAEKLSYMKTHGAIDEITVLQTEQAKLRERLSRCKQWQKDLLDLADKQKTVTQDKEDLIKAAKRDFEEGNTRFELLLASFKLYTEKLYSEAGEMKVGVDDQGYEYNIELAKGESDGVRRMGIFCFDLAMLEYLQTWLGKRIDFLIHDTPIFDAVDARQRALALELAHEVTHSFGGQYICPMNSDKVPWNEFSKGFDFKSCVRLTLSDASAADSLLGIAFERG